MSTASVEVRRGDMELIWVDSDDWPVFFMKIANMEGVLTVKGVDVVVEFIPKVWSDRAIYDKPENKLYQNDSAASLGPGNEEIGLK
jgi:hypothetical protein